MSLPYIARLFVLCGAAFFLLHTTLALAVCMIAAKMIRFAEGMKPSSSARFLLAVRILPLSLTFFVVFGLCIPSYLWLEPRAAGEEVGFVCVLLALLATLTWAISIQRAAAAIAATRRYLHRCERTSHAARVPGNHPPVLVLEEDSPVLATAGVLHPQLIVSQWIMRALHAEEIEAALSHEHGHQLSRDNLKRLLILLAPDIFPFVRGFAKLERSWAKFTEWAADDHAVAGDPHRAVSLASALVAVAKMNSHAKLPSLAVALVAVDRDLSERVDRLLHSRLEPERTFSSVARLGSGAVAVLTTALLLILLCPASLATVHQVLEHLVR